MTERSNAEIRAEITTTLDANVRELEAAILSGDIGGYVFFYPQYCLAVRLYDDGKSGGVRADRGTVVASDDRRRFYNGKHEQAELTPRLQALQLSLDHARKTRDELLAAFKD